VVRCELVAFAGQRISFAIKIARFWWVFSAESAFRAVLLRQDALWMGAWAFTQLLTYRINTNN